VVIRAVPTRPRTALSVTARPRDRMSSTAVTTSFFFGPALSPPATRPVRREGLPSPHPSGHSQATKTDFQPAVVLNLESVFDSIRSIAISWHSWSCS